MNREKTPGAVVVRFVGEDMTPNEARQGSKAFCEGSLVESTDDVRRIEYSGQIGDIWSAVILIERKHEINFERILILKGF